MRENARNRIGKTAKLNPREKGLTWKNAKFLPAKKIQLQYP